MRLVRTFYKNVEINRGDNGIHVLIADDPVYIPNRIDHKHPLFRRIDNFCPGFVFQYKIRILNCDNQLIAQLLCTFK